MKKAVLFATAFLVLFSATCRAEWPADEIVEKCDPFYLRTMEPEYLRILRNAVYATHGRAFQSRDLQDYFKGEYWYKASPDFSEDMLSAQEKECVATIKQVEDELTAKLKALKGKQRVDDVDMLTNTHLFGDLDAHTRELLQSDGFAILPTEEEQLFHIYEQNEYQRIPSFVTADLVLQLYHQFFDSSLRSIEQRRLLPQLENLVAGMYRFYTSSGLPAQLPAQQARVRRSNAAFFAVAALLLEMDIDLKQLDPEMREAVQKELELIRKHERREDSFLFPYKIDYSQFIPRGHYTRSEELKRYFLAMMWLGNTLFAFDTDNELAKGVTKEDTDYLIQQALSISNALHTGMTKDGDSLLHVWHSLYDITEFLVGAADDLTPEQLYEIGEGVYGSLPSADVYTDPAKLDNVRALAKEKNPARIKQEFKGAPNTVQFRFMGQRYVPDSEMLQRLSHFPDRPLPKGLDVMAVLGSDLAESLLFDLYKEGEGWDEFEPRFRALEKDFAKLTPEQWRQNMYYGWLWTLQALVAERPTGEAIPYFATTEAWDKKNLNTSLASWAELRHDTLLYAKQSITAECGDGGEFVNPAKPRGYVEPNAEAFRRLELLTKLSIEGLERFGYLEEPDDGNYAQYPLSSKYDMVLELVTFLRKAAEKQLAGQALSREEYDYINVIGGVVERVTLSMFEPSPQYWELVNESDRFMAVIADVHTQGDNILEEAVGFPHELLIIAPVDGIPYLMRGAVFSYYEFVSRNSERLTDEAWQKLIKGGDIPDPPEWMRELLIPQKRKPAGGKVFYSSGC